MTAVKSKDSSTTGGYKEADNHLQTWEPGFCSQENTGPLAELAGFCNKKADKKPEGKGALPNNLMLQESFLSWVK